ncbi:MAG: hypothetical protein U1E35_03175 [Rhodospirillales bacterium]
MGASIASERRRSARTSTRRLFAAISAAQRGPRDELIDLARWRCVRSATGFATSSTSTAASAAARRRRGGRHRYAERARIAAKKQIFSRALRQVNGRLDLHRATTKREQAVANLRRAVARKASRKPVTPGQDGPQAKACRQSRIAAPKT